jgi:Xaa-Pro aminopeptidase
MNYADNTYHFRQDSTFLYFFGLDQASLIGVIDAETGESILFGDELSIDMIVWTGTLPGLTFLGEQVGVDQVRPLAELDAFFPWLFLNKETSIS